MYTVVVDHSGLNNFYIIIEVLLCVGIRRRHVPTHYFDNRMVVVHPALSKVIRTQNAHAVWEERIVGTLHKKAAKDAILAAEAIAMVFSVVIVRKFDFLLGLSCEEA